MIIGTENNKDLKYNDENLKKHFIALGASGSGKTVLCKSVIEQSNVPCILIDSQGDLASLDGAKIYTPASKKGIHLSLNPFKYCDNEEVIENVSTTISELAGYKQGSSKFNNAKYLIYEILNKNKVKNFDQLIDKIESSEGSDFYVKSETNALIRKLKTFTIGKNSMLFNSGVPLDISSMLKNKINIIYINTLEEGTKKCFLAMLSTQLYHWMLHNPSKKLQALFFIDEIEQFIPAGSIKPASKDILKQIFKQARKYGVGCMAATQNPGDIDYKAFAQFGTWGIGRLTTKQDMSKVKDVIGKKDLSKLKPGEFYLFCPDEYDKIKLIKTKRLKSEHKTLTLNDMDDKTKKDKPKIEIKSNVSKIKTFPINYALDKIIKKYQKKKFLVFGQKEKLMKSELTYLPIFKLQARQKRIIGFKNYYLHVNAMTSKILSNKGMIDLDKVNDKISSYKLNIIPEDNPIQGKVLKTKSSLANIKKKIEQKFDCEVIHHEIIYLPIYELEFEQNKTIRKTRISAYSGDET